MDSRHGDIVDRYVGVRTVADWAAPAAATQLWATLVACAHRLSSLAVLSAGLRVHVDGGSRGSAGFSAGRLYTDTFDTGCGDRDRNGDRRLSEHAHIENGDGRFRAGH